MISLSNRIDERSFRRLALLTIIAVFLLILVGGVVRSTGSGMGCPDWPRCFGQWVPPTDVSELPANYKEIYSHRGYASTEFNATKTWIEYLNRLLGVLIGALIFFTAATSVVVYWKRDRVVAGCSLLALFLVGFQGWLGAQVVASVLSVWLITLHMLVALVILGVLLYVLTRTQLHKSTSEIIDMSVSTQRWLLVSSALLFTQILFGTQVREAVDEVSIRLGNSQRFQWIESLGIRFYLHRSFSLVVLASQLLWIWPVYSQKVHNPVAKSFAVSVGALLLAEIATGVIMAYLAIPAWAQPVHLTLAVAALGIQFVVILLAYRKATVRSTQRTGSLPLIKSVRTGSITAS